VHGGERGDGFNKIEGGRLVRPIAAAVRFTFGLHEAGVALLPFLYFTGNEIAPRRAVSSRNAVRCAMTRAM
jgi:hypothetical protein